MCLKRIFFAVCTISCVDSWIGHAITSSFIFLPLSIPLNCNMYIIYEAVACARTLPYLLKPGRVGSTLRTWPHEVEEFPSIHGPKKQVGVMQIRFYVIYFVGLRAFQHSVPL